MKKLLISLVILFCQQTNAQTQALQELKLNIEKLAQLKAMLNNMYSGYSILSEGYINLKSQSLANFNLHKTFIEGLSQISPAVRNAPEIAAILQAQAQIVSEYKTAFQKISTGKLLNPAELNGLINNYSAVSRKSSQILDALKQLLTPGNLQMSEAERINFLASLRTDMEIQLGLIRNFTSQAYQLAEFRLRMKKEHQTLRKTFGISK
jgi:hypothetical protein